MSAHKERTTVVSEVNETKRNNETRAVFSLELIEERIKDNLKDSALMQMME